MLPADNVQLEDVLRLARQLPPAEQARLRAAMPETADDAEREAQRKRNQAAIALLDSWLADTTDYDDNEGGDSWDNVLRAIDADRYTSRTLFPHLADEP